jgi:hypothetical protein
MFILNGLMDALLMSTKRGQTIGMIIGMQWMKNLKHIYNPNFLCITSWERCSMFGMEIIDSKLVIDKSMRYMRKTNQGIHVWVTSWVFDANMDNHGALQSIMDGVNVWIQLLSPLILFVCDTKIIHQIFMLFFYGHIGQWKGHVWCQGLHFICKVNMVGLTILTKWKNVSKKEQYNECIKKVGKTWYHLTIHAMIEILFKVYFLPFI